MLAKTYAIAHIIASRGVNDDEAPEWDWDPIGSVLQEETGQEAANTSEECFGAPLVTFLLGTGAQYDEESTARDRRIPELDHMTHEDQEGQQFQTPGGLMQSSQEDRLTLETLGPDYFPPGQDDPRHYFSSPIPSTSVGQSLTPVTTPFASTTPTSLPNTGPQTSPLSHMTSAGTVSSLDGSGVCPECGYKVSVAKEDEDRNKNVRRHLREKHGQSVKCPQCGQNFSRPSNMKRHITNTHE